MAKKKKVDEAVLSPKEAVALLSVHLEGKKKRVHTFTGMGFALMGCDIDLTSLEARLKKSGHVCLSGDNMKSMGHGVAVHEEGKGYMFLETDKAKLEAIHKKRGIK